MTRPPAVGVSSASTGSIASGPTRGSSGGGAGPMRSPGDTGAACQNVPTALFLRPRLGGLETYVRELVPALLETRPDLRIVVFSAGSGRELLEAESWAD